MDKSLRQSLLCLIACCCAGLLAACNLTNAPAETVTPAVEDFDPTMTPVNVGTPTQTPDAGELTPSLTLMPTQPQPTSVLPATPRSAVIVRPEAGSTVSGSPLELSGTVFGLAEDRFNIELRDASGRVVNRQEITLRNPSGAVEIPWSASLITGYTGPAEIRIVARNRSGREFIAASVSIVIASSSADAPIERASTPSVTIEVPAPGAALGGDVIQVRGMAGGLPEGTFLLDLRSAAGATLNRQIINLAASDRALMVPWSASLALAGFRGEVEIVASYVPASAGDAIILARVPVTLR